MLPKSVVNVELPTIITDIQRRSDVERLKLAALGPHLALISTSKRYLTRTEREISEWDMACHVTNQGKRGGVSYLYTAASVLRLWGLEGRKDEFFGEDSSRPDIALSKCAGILNSREKVRLKSKGVLASK